MEKQQTNIQKMELVKKSDTFKLIIPEEVENKIRYICRQIWNVEWSGTLFYKPEGKFEDGTLIIRCVDIYVMDIGTQVYTEFDMSPEVINYMTENQNLLDCQMGLIHSHNQMSSFFSTTDIATLKEEGVDRNHFVSLIVNNAGSYTAAITRKVETIKVIKEDYSFSTFGNDKIKNAKSYQVKNEELEWFNLDIEFEKDENTAYSEVKSRLEQIKESKAQKANQQFFKPVNDGYTNHKGGIQQPSLFPEYDEIKKKTLQFYGDNANSKSSQNKEIKDTDFSFDYQYMDNKILDDIPYEKVKFNKDTIKSLVLQLVTGSIIIPNTSKIDVRNWVQGMIPLYEKRFGKGNEGLELFRIWAEGYIEFLCWNTYDENLQNQGWEIDELASICAYDILSELTNLPKNIYIEEYINILENYII